MRAIYPRDCQDGFADTKNKVKTPPNQTMTPNERFAKAAGIEWQNSIERYIHCRSCTCANHYNPDFTDAREVLRVMMEREDWGAFAESLRRRSEDAEIGTMAYIFDFVMDHTGKLRDLATEWLEGRK